MYDEKPCDVESPHAKVASCDARLLRLPGEVLNIIFELSAPTKSFVALHASGTRKQTIAFHPRQPALASTCRKLRDQFPLEQYYATNLFLLTESMFLPGRLEEFFAGRPLAKRYLRHARIDLLGIPWIDPSSRKLFLSAQSRVRFTARVTNDGEVVISRLKTKVCCCWLHAIAKRASIGNDHEGHLAEFLLGYAAKINGRYAESRQTCPECGMAKTGSNAEDLNARFVIFFIFGLFFVVLGMLLKTRITG
ncbi:uncharacterized protein K489DRAFT_402910 [Dissoconium aciculare CBS 342.82]|jgi:hypothetical protein|uniref:Uncharacterized protein n=1 Tax=Dissoconium aciculare CBS 342.82 TaxID=1314786 RepID=A0A6J3M2H6_9PEZI|nr:uncharacterized protein K489DRAFT_402910 [Dissoconium aciculare CBS 342.82]KAF1821122.1 hypothetical protein K489DRAFT_402910 [Dissoconium aciculare CBS 342.82]